MHATSRKSLIDNTLPSQGPKVGGAGVKKADIFLSLPGAVCRNHAA